MTAAGVEAQAGPGGRLASLVGWAEAHPVLATVIVAAAVRLGVALVSFLFIGNLFNDEGSYLNVARAVASGHGADSWIRGYGQSFYDSTWGFTGPIAAAFRVVTPTRLVGQLYAVALGVAAAGLTARLAVELLPRRYALGAGLVVALLPSQVIWSSAVLRESAVWAGLALVALAVTSSTRVSGLRLVLPALLAASGLLFLGVVRTQTLLAASWALVLVVPFLPGPARLLRSAGALAIVLVVPLAAGIGIGGIDLVRAGAPTLAATRTNMGVGARSEFATPKGTATGADPKALSGMPAYCRDGQQGGALAIACLNARRVQSTDGSNGTLILGPDLQVYEIDTGISSNLAQLPRGLVGSLLRPFPWERAANLSVWMAKVENVAWYVLYALAAIGAVLAGWRSRRVLAYPIVVTTFLVGISALAEGNLGSAFRHRGQLVWALALLAAVGARGVVARRQTGRWA